MVIKKAHPFLRQVDKGQPFIVQRALHNYQSPIFDGQKGGYHDLDELKRTCDSDLLNHTFNSIRYLAFILHSCPPILCSGTFGPYADIDGNVVQDLTNNNLVMDAMTISMLPNDSKGIFVMSWRDTGKSGCRDFAESFLRKSDRDISNILLEFIIACTENLFICPDWWDHLSDSERKYYDDLFTQTCSPANWCDANIFTRLGQSMNRDVQVYKRIIRIRNEINVDNMD